MTRPMFTPRSRGAAGDLHSAAPAPPPDSHFLHAAPRISRHGLGESLICRASLQQSDDFARAGREGIPPRTAAQPSCGMVFRPVDRPKRCKLGCGRLANHDQQKVHDACCRACAMCQGAGDHDSGCSGGATLDTNAFSTVSASEDAETLAVMTVDHALEMRRRAKEADSVGDTVRARALLADSTEQLERAQRQISPGSPLAPLLDSAIMETWQRVHAGPDDSSVGPLELEIDAELDRVVATLEDGMMAVLGGVTSHAAAEAVEVQQSLCATSTAHGAEIVAACSELATFDQSVCGSSDVRNGGAGGHVDGDGRKGRSPASSGSHPAQAALRALRLDDEWPTELTRGEIRRRYMREALQSHPDKGPATEKAWRTKRFQEISDAYSTMELYISLLERMRGGVSAGETEEDTLASRVSDEREAAPLDGSLLELGSGYQALAAPGEDAYDRTLCAGAAALLPPT
eukprot:TRINITY_DN38529_c0_g1_i1.p1 TRINITY_DN38529_c0_g1~~TRINITY_DN38529_c0_g1_i1.p1  ORF type:complete len:460 (-),score=52.71 TRINITY_DN38529_c0_g1_i1:161-1540(-)